MKQNSWISIVFSFASQCRGKIALSVLCAIISVVAGLIPYWSVYQIITLFIGGSPVMAEVWKWCWIGLGAYAIRFLLYGISTSLSHISAYTILENIRLTLAQRLMKAPLGTVIGESVGKLKSVLVDRVETIELPLAHMIPECISNLLLPVAVFVYLVCIDWRMALAMLVTVPLAFIAFAMMMKNFNKLYADYMESNNYVNGVIVEYVEGIEVIKAFNQSSSSYHKGGSIFQGLHSQMVSKHLEVDEFYFCGIAFHLPWNAPDWYVSLLDRKPGSAGSCYVPDPLAGDCRSVDELYHLCQ